MAELPLYDPSPPDPDGWHSVRAPGGYERWYFDAEDASADVRVVAVFMEGADSHPEYQRRYDRYRRHPTRHAPPQPGEYPGAYLAVYKGGRAIARLTTHVPPTEFAAAADRVDVRVGNNTLRRDADGCLRLRIGGAPVSAELEYRPLLTGAAHERAAFSREATGADHRWIIANPLCAVRGTIRLGDEGAIALTGRGYHDHDFGTAPIGSGLQRYFRGRVLGEDRAFTFHAARPGDEALSDEVQFLEADATGIRDAPPGPVYVEWARNARYPSSLELGERLALRSPQVIDSSPAELWIVYEARWDGRVGKGWCEVACP